MLGKKVRTLCYNSLERDEGRRRKRKRRRRRRRRRRRKRVMEERCRRRGKGEVCKGREQ